MDDDAGSDVGRFNPGETYPGEGTACEFSLLCAERQICVDGECIRHERVNADELELGEFRNLYGEGLEASPLYTEAEWDWDEREVLEGAIHSFVYPGPDGPQTLFFTDDSQDCQVALYGSTLRIFGVRNMTCTAAGVNPEGRVVVGGVDRPDGHAQLVVFDSADREVRRHDLTEELAEAVEPALDGEAVGGIPTSFLWDEDGFIISLSVGEGSCLEPWCPSVTGFYSESTVFARLSDDGSVSPVEIGGRTVHEGARGWLLRDEDGVKAILSDLWDGLASPEPIVYEGPTTDLLSLSDGSRTPLFEGVSLEARAFQPAPQRWYYVALDHPAPCEQTVFSPDREPLTAPWIRFANQEDCMRTRDPTAPDPFNRNGACGATVPGHSTVLGSAIEAVGSGDVDWELRFLGSERVEALRDPPVQLALTQPSVAARFGKTYEVIAGYYEEISREQPQTALSWWEATLRRK